MTDHACAPTCDAVEAVSSRHICCVCPPVARRSPWPPVPPPAHASYTIIPPPCCMVPSVFSLPTSFPASSPPFSLRPPPPPAPPPTKASPAAARESPGRDRSPARLLARRTLLFAPPSLSASSVFRQVQFAPRRRNPVLDSIDRGAAMPASA
ncbi:hypothetical protein BDA96_10G225000 [Sorghum bicolor]|uniref:Uncharacterized protein n=1 Tax=Sorghum bicolor TaxID=4558 RepID=A0A921Q5N2_SORBI|nr:hypothetical protein BDA96_10G225000 [Sorghum bicolor]